MTNKTIDGVPRELLEQMVCCAEAYVDIDDADLITLRVLLAAPEVPRQEPFMYGTCSLTGSRITASFVFQVRLQTLRVKLNQ